MVAVADGTLIAVTMTAIGRERERPLAIAAVEAVDGTREGQLGSSIWSAFSGPHCGWGSGLHRGRGGEGGLT